MAKRKRKKQYNQSLPKWAITTFAVLAVVLSVITFGGELTGMDTSFFQQCLDRIDRILYGGPTSPAPSLPATGEAKVYIIDVGQGESILITTDEKSMLIDAGENNMGDEVLEFIDTLGLDSLDYALATHPHSDHIGGLDTVLENIPVGEVLDVIEQKNIPLTQVDSGDTIDLGSGAVVTVLGPVTEEVEDLNNTSVVCRLDFGETSFLFNGDQEEPMEQLLIENNANLDCDMMTMGHHGSSTSSSREYLDAVSPEYASISCGKANKYGHPHDETVENLEQLDIPYYRTDLSGNITFTSDGETISVRTEKP